MAILKKKEITILLCYDTTAIVGYATQEKHKTFSPDLSKQYAACSKMVEKRKWFYVYVHDFKTKEMVLHAKVNKQYVMVVSYK